jgi:uncharacterized protein (TIGR03118 family)
MKTKLKKRNTMIAAGILVLTLATRTSPAATNEGYAQVNLVSDGTTNALHHDKRLVNPWGIVAAEEVVWANDNGSGLATVYTPLGLPLQFAIHIPGPDGSTNSGTPDGLVWNQTALFAITNGSKHGASTFLMATEDGTIAAWNASVTGSNAVIVVDNSASGAVYKGLAIFRDTNDVPHLYAANFHAGTIDEFDGNFQFVQSFTDTNVPAGFAPFNVRVLRDHLFVTFAKQKQPDRHDDDAGLGNGFVDIFGADGTVLRRFASNGALNSPWGLAVAPANFGNFSHALLVGNFGDGRINAYDLLTGRLLGNLTQPDGSDLVINGLWGLTFEREAVHGFLDFDANRLYFTAGINDEADGLLGYIHPSGPIVVRPVTGVSDR